MDSFRQHVLICDPQPSEADLADWRDAVGAIAASVMRVNSPQGLFDLSNDLGWIVENQTIGNGELSTHVNRTLGRRGATGLGNDHVLARSVCAMLAMRQVLEDGGGSKRGVMAVATWSALSFGAPLAEARLESLRREILSYAQRGALELASRGRQRFEESGGTARRATVPAKQLYEANEGLRRNAMLDREEIRILRWLLADDSRALGCSFGNIAQAETATLAMGLELGQLLTVFPTVSHYRLGDRFVEENGALDLCRLVEAVGADRPKLAASCPEHPVMEACPFVFPLLTALRDGSTSGEGAHIERRMAEWWGRALLESAAVVVGSKKGWS